MSSRSHITFAVSSLALAATIGGAAYTATVGITPKAAGVVAQTFADDDGIVGTTTPTGTIDNTNPFFRPLGTNGRACVTCHQPSQGWSVTPAGIQARFNATGGTDPIFRTNDGSNSPNDDVSTVAARQEAYSMLLTKGLFRIGIGVPANAEFNLIAVDDPYGFASANQLSLFRRPLPSTNLQFLSAVMWDGRESPAGSTIAQNLASQATDAITGHEQGVTPPPTAIASIVAFETSLTTAQTFDNAAGSLTANGATGGPIALSAQSFTPGVNDPGAPTFNPHVFSLYDSWSGVTAAAATAPTLGARLLIGGRPAGPTLGAPVLGLPAPPPPAGPAPTKQPPTSPTSPTQPPTSPTQPPTQPTQPPTSPTQPTQPPTSPTQPTQPTSPTSLAQQSVARGEAIFNGRPFNITNVPGLTDVANVPALRGTCTTCHNTPNVGNHSTALFLNIGTAAPVVRTPDLPLYTFQNKTTGQIIQTSDPGRALVTGKWADIGKFKVPDLRGLSSRSPYFHNGLGTDEVAVVSFYNRRFNIGLSAQEVTDLANFLKTL